MAKATEVTSTTGVKGTLGGGGLVMAGAKVRLTLVAIG